MICSSDVTVYLLFIYCLSYFFWAFHLEISSHWLCTNNGKDRTLKIKTFDSCKTFDWWCNETPSIIIVTLNDVSMCNM